MTPEQINDKSEPSLDAEGRCACVVCRTRRMRMRDDRHETPIVSIEPVEEEE